ncbi:MAG TPA: hypothetical protein VFJ17_15140 [Mycobacteriales bacterium]|jgi:hypothetical protein|nr:hypothetical protein [Mycobacteriales bacterium]
MTNSTRMSRLEAGAVVDELDVPGVGIVPVRVQRCPAGWLATFEVRDPATSDLAVMHKLVAPTYREAKAAVPQAIAFLLGHPVDAPVQNG